MTSSNLSPGLKTIKENGGVSGSPTGTNRLNFLYSQTSTFQYYAELGLFAQNQLAMNKYI